ncbi:MAG: leucine-rich repeat domain-containing protein [Muribaculaceae bacterium]|nr:leucine-rich repeat domain-containing protein [Muribaculaceae bacterium]
MKSFMKCSFLVSKAVLLSVFCLFCVITGKANEEVTIGGLNYMLCYNDDFSDYYASVSDNLNFSGTSVTIPEKIRHTVSYQENGETKSVTLDFPVISIGHGAFKQCENLTSVTTGNRVERIGGYAFIGCINLTSVTIGNRVEIIGDLAFAECENLTSVTIGNRVKEIGGGAFQYCSSITDLCVGDSVRYVHSSAFYGVSPKNLIWKAKKYYTRDSEDAVGSEIIKMDCSNVENLTILQPAERLPERFCSGAKITSVNVPDYVTYIGANAFSGCRNLTHVTIGDNMTSVEDHVFDGCTGITYLSIGASVSTIGLQAFYGVSPKTLVWKAASCRFKKYPNDSYLYNDMLINCDDVEELQILSPASVLPTNFCNGSKITSVSFPSSLTYIYQSFKNCENLENVSFSNGSASISSSFNDCGNLASVNFSNGSPSVSTCFNNCGNLASVNFSNGSASISKSFNNCGNLESVDFSNAVTKVSGFNDCENLTSINLSGVEYIGEPAYIDEWDSNNDRLEELAFSNCPNLTEVNFPNTVKRIIGFNNCTGLTSINIPSSVTELTYLEWGPCAYARPFYGCSNITSIIVDKDNPVYDSRNGCNAIIETESNSLIAGCKTTVIPNSVTSIGRYAFTGSGITSIVIPGSVNSVEGFVDCTDLTSITCESTTPPYCGLWDGLYEQATLYVPSSALQDYKNAWGWRSFLNIVGIGGGWIDLPGDVDGNQEITIDDLAALIDLLLNGTENANPGADCDQNGVVTIDDVAALIDMLLKG